MKRTVSRREALRTAAALAGAALLPACLGPSNPPVVAVDPHLLARPGTPTETGSKGTTVAALTESTALVYVPDGVAQETPAPLLLFLHGAGRNAQAFVDAHKAAADTAKVIVLAPFATEGTWDAIQGTFSRDVIVMNEALEWVFKRWRVDPTRIVLSGFSDGATYALGMGRANGDLFTKLVAYSPGFLIEVTEVGKPPILITHGLEDPVLPISQTSRMIVPILQQRDYTVDYREFHGEHVVLQSVVNEVVAELGPTT